MPDPIWIFAGTIEPSFSEWQTFSESTVSGNLLRLSFSAIDGGPLSPIYSYILLQRIWDTYSPLSKEFVSKIYGNLQQSLILHAPITPDHQNAGLITASYQCKLGYKYKNKGWLEPRYTVSLEWQ